jgi:hypothetical protein
MRAKASIPAATPLLAREGVSAARRVVVRVRQNALMLLLADAALSLELLPPLLQRHPPQPDSPAERPTAVYPSPISWRTPRDVRTIRFDQSVHVAHLVAKFVRLALAE